ncbi:MAG: hypothetical protein JJT96_03405 [Opitutales bacterium]|nr:hypothetical protein [Opitutales bacterium]
MNPKHHLSALAVSLSLLAGPFALPAKASGESLAQHFGANTVYFFEKAPQTEIGNALEKSPLNALFTDEAFRNFTAALLLAPMRAAQAESRNTEASSDDPLGLIRETTGLSAEDLTRLLAGRIAGGVTLDHPERLARVLREMGEMGDLKDDEDNTRAFQLIADLGVHASLVLTHDGEGDLLRRAIRQVVEKANEDEPVITLDERTEGEFEIFELTFEENPDAPVRVLAAIGQSRALLTAGAVDAATLTTRLTGADQTLADTPLYLEASDALPGAHLRLLLNPGALFDTLLRHSLTQLFSGNPMLGGMLSPPNQIADALRVDAFTGLFASFSFDDEGALAQAGATFNRDAGLVGEILALNRAGPLPRMDFVPRDATSMSASTFDNGALLALIERAVGIVSPLYANVYEGFKMQLRGESGIDLDSMLLRNLTAGFVNFSRPLRPDEMPMLPPGMPTENLNLEGNIFAISLQNGARLVDGLDRARESFPAGAMFEKSDFLDVPLYLSPMAEAQGMQQGLAVADDVLLFGQGSLSLLRETLTLWKTPGDSLADEAHMQAFMRTLPGNTSGIGYADINSLLRTFFTAASFGAQSAFGAIGTEGARLDLPPVPDLSSHRFHSHSVTLDIPAGSRTDVRISPKND